jgi:hypothetical protein
MKSPNPTFLLESDRRVPNTSQSEHLAQPPRATQDVLIDKVRLSTYSDLGVLRTRKEAGMRVIRSSWQTEANRLICRWSEAKEERFPYNPPWIQEAFKTPPHRERVSPLVLELDFRRLSPLAGRGWFERALEGFTLRPTCRQ